MDGTAPQVNIPVRNLYYLYLYAWDRLREADAVPVGSEDSPSIKDLFARVLSTGVELTIRKGLERSYESTTQPVQGIRGKLLIAPSVASGSLPRAWAVCEVDELTYDTRANRIISATLARLLDADITPTCRDLVSAAYRRFPRVSRMQLTPSSFTGIQLHANTSHYGFLLDVCRFLLEGSAPTTLDAGRLFWTPDATEGLGLVFQRFVRNFLAWEQSSYRVTAPWIRWHGIVASDEDMSVLPVMQTDILLQKSDRALLIDTKYYATTMTEHHDVSRIRPQHLYQVFTYLTNVRPTVTGRLDGLILYPQVERPLRARFQFSDFGITVATIDLSRSWQNIRSDLLALTVGGEA